MADNRVIVELGTVIKNRGEWDNLAQNAKLYKDNVVQYNGSAYIVKSAPASGIGKDILPTNTAYYEVFAGVGEVATGSDFDAPSAAQRGKITTVGAVLDGMNDGVYNLTAKTGDSYATLNDALIAANNTIPTNKKRGGMSICFVNSTDNKYVQYRLMADEFTTDTTQWVICGDDVLVENPEFLKVYTDKDNRVLWAIRVDGSIYYGAGIPPQIIDYIQQKIDELSLDEYEDIVTFLDGLEEGDTTLRTMLTNLNTAIGNEVTRATTAEGTKVDKVTGKSLIDAGYAESMSSVENPEWMDVKTDNEDKILEGTRIEGRKVYNIPVEVLGNKTDVVDNEEFVNVVTDGNDSVLLGIRKNGDVHFGKGVPSQINKEIQGIKRDINEISGVANEQYLEVADGKLIAYGNKKTELEASPIINDYSKQFVGSHTIKKDKAKDDISLPIVAMNHDDLPVADYSGTKKIYNKYGFTASFCWVFELFTSVSQKESEIAGIKALIADGHEVGLHSMFNKTYWLSNPLYDVKPDGSSNFAPQISELRGAEADGTGTDTFGKTITANTKLSDVGYRLPYTNPKIVELDPEDATDIAELNLVNQYYTWYGDLDTMTGLDLDDNSQTWTRLKWLEYFCNQWFDSSLGYSSSAATLAGRFAEDYDDPTKYPDAEHILNGKMVHYQDTTNSHYNDANYQKVGKFTKGIFKGSYTCCNYEIFDRCIAVAEKFAQVFFGLNHFTDCHKHGMQSVLLYYIGDDNATYLNREKSVVDGGFGRFFISRNEAFSKQIDILGAFGIREICHDSYHLNTKIQGNIGMFYGQSGLRNPNINNVLNNSDTASLIDYGNLFKYRENTSNPFPDGVPYMDYATYMQFIDAMPSDISWTRFFYENAGKTANIVDGEIDFDDTNPKHWQVTTTLRDCIEKIRSSVDTGKVPLISLDTITANPSCSQMMELLCRYCKQNGFRMVSLNRAQDITLSKGRDCSGNMFPNPAFNQSFLDYIGGYSDSKFAYIPDGWEFDSTYRSVTDTSVTTEEINGKEHRVFMLTSNQYSRLYTKMYGLKAGTYKFTILCKSDSGSPLAIYKCKGKNLLNGGDTIESITMPTDWDEKEVVFEIDAPYKKASDITDGINQMCDGYEDCVYAIRCRLTCYANDTVYIANPILQKIN